MVPVSCFCSTPCSSAATTYSARIGSTAPFIVIDTLVWPSGMPSNRMRMSRMLSIATPAMPTSPITRGLSES